MQPEGMVHALKLIYTLLGSSGSLIDIHPSGEKPAIEVVAGARRELAGFLEESDDFTEYFQAENALLQSVTNRYFRLERRETFPFYTFAADIGELQAYLAENWKDAILLNEVIARTQQLAKSLPSDNQVVLTESITISLLKPLPIPHSSDES